MRIRRQTWTLGLAALAALAVGVGGALQVSQAAGPERVLAQADAIAKRVAVLRGLSIREPIKRGVMNKEQLTVRLLERVHQEYRPEDIAAEEMAIKRLGLLDHKASYLDSVLDLLKNQIAGFYDPWERQLYLAEWTTIGGEAVLAHEVDHALQDQHFDLQKWIFEEKHNADATTARQALVEGDGTVLMMEFSADQVGETPPWQDREFVLEQARTMRLNMAFMGSAPLILRESLVFPYATGLKFVAHFRKTRPWSAIDAIYRRPPRSTEQIIHPEAYERDEKPVEITSVQPVTLANYNRGYDNVSGELMMWIFLRQHGVEADVAKVAVAGWGGDRIAVFTPPDYDGVVSAAVAIQYSVWDSEPDADEFFASLTRGLAVLSDAKDTNPLSDTRVEYRGRDGAVVLAERRKEAVVMVIGVAPARANDVREQVWADWVVRRP